ncbi:MAG: hypothetical protein F6K18_16225 [Okeania sp. SIO2C2]|uniref:hypothetical protein n=1 Tax=Okeania sp. SIO2C2 TaxID=2607787 RepID=UPI0013BE2B2B|nr:hypothetical protein [Okeania sp. SIO2C2]NEP88251.1 hypothetical protein [Okeania sp. SIO2C2]
MKNIKFNDLEKQFLLAEKELISIEHEGKTIGYYYPIGDREAAQKAKEELDRILEKTLPPTELTEEKIASMFSKIDHEAVHEAAEKLKAINAEILATTGLTEDEYVSMFMNAIEDEESCV